MAKVAKELAGGDSGGLARLPRRLWPSVAWFAAAEGVDIEKTFQSLAEEAGKGADAAALSFRSTRFQQAIKNVVAPILSEENDGVKRPPPDLFHDVKDVVFVGGSNDGLPKLFRDFAEDNPNKKKRLIRVLYLTESSVRKLSHSGRSANDLAAGRQASLNALTPELMNSIAESWQILEYETPYFFASFWDADEPGGRIHVSSHGWGQDIKKAPAVDYVWPKTAKSPNRKYQWFAQAVVSLMGDISEAVTTSDDVGNQRA